MRRFLIFGGVVVVVAVATNTVPVIVTGPVAKLRLLRPALHKGHALDGVTKVEPLHLGQDLANAHLLLVLPCLPFWKEGGDDAGEESNCCVEFAITLVVVFLIVGLLGMPWPPSRN